MKKNINQKPNSLLNEKNPYLLQHAYNPVDWHPWCDEAFEIAEHNMKPIFLSIGYSTCHWCHVMAHESFEDADIAALMNETFINIKVDREERPDIDGIYMDICQIMTGSGGWPLTIIMTPEKKPFFAGTYFPKDSVFGRIGMKELIPKIAELWKSRKEDIYTSAEELTNKVGALKPDFSNKDLPIDIFDDVYELLSSSYDEEYGGFGTSPKFPIPHNLTFLMRYFKSTGKESALKIVEKTLTEMGKGGIYDQIGFGFHRYSTDRQWLVPHFEKMLYDQALLTIAYSEAFQLTHSDFLKNKIIEVLTYVQRDLTSPEGGFYSAEDADSEGFEGKFYLWDAKELNDILKDDFEIFRKAYNIKEKGNFIDKAGHAPERQNIPFITKDISEISEELEISDIDVKNKINKIRRKLFDIREKRIHPHKDDKILTDWNGLMIAAFAKAGRILGDDDYLRIAENASTFVENMMYDSEGRLLHRYHTGEASINANIDDYAFYIFGLLELYFSTFEIKYLKNALKLNEFLVLHSWDNQNNGFFFTADYSEKLIIRKKDIYDGAIPSGNSIQLMNLLRLWKITGDISFKNYVDKIIKAFSGTILKMPTGYTEFLNGFGFAVNDSVEIVMVADDKSDMKPFQKILMRYFIPNIVVLFKCPANEEEIIAIAPYTNDMITIENKPTVYFCRNYACEIPITDIHEFEIKLKQLFQRT